MRKMFSALSLTWGLPLTLCGAVVALFLLAIGHRPHRWGSCWCFEVGESNWGGLSLGSIILCQPNAPDSLKNHEFGHAIQNCYLGPFMIPLVLCSVARYHDRNRRVKRGEKLPPYDSWWFEGWATRLGERIHNKYYNN